MRIRLDIPDRLLRTALEDLLAECGHDVLSSPANDGDWGLRIALEASAAGDNGATLLLRPAADLPADADPGSALRRALETGGTAVWRPPLDAGLLASTLEGEAGTVSPDQEALRAPLDLTAAAYPWILFDRSATHVLREGAGARDLVEMPEDLKRPALDELELPEPFRHAFVREAEGHMRVTLSQAPHLAAWWTDLAGRRLLFLLPIPEGAGAADARHLRTLAQIGRMAATLAHEIRNPVASVAGALDLLEREGDEEERAEIVRMARERLAEMRMLLDDTLRMARPLRGEPEVIEAQSLIQSALGSIRTDPIVARVTMRVEAPAETVRILGHPEPLRQALTNLLLNAAQALKGKGRVSIELTSRRRRAVLRVRDEGPGIPDEAREEVFAPFYTTKTKGTGLGLAFVRRVVESVGGTVLAEPSSTGACIRLELPIAH